MVSQCCIHPVAYIANLAPLQDGVAVDLGKNFVLHGPAGSVSLKNILSRFECRPGDRGALDPPSKERCELSGHTDKFSLGEEIWVSYSMFVMPYSDFTYYTIVGQLHSTHATQNSVAICYMNITPSNNYSFTVWSSADPQDVVIKTLQDSPAAKAKWVNYVHKIVCSPFSNGQWKVWRNGAQVVDYSGPLGQDGTAGDYWKFGIYRTSVVNSHRTVVWFSNVEVGGDLEQRITAPLAVEQCAAW